MIGVDQICNGFPFVDRNFSAQKLITATCCARFVQIHSDRMANSLPTPDASDLGSLIDPTGAWFSFRQSGSLLKPYSDATADHLDAIDLALREITIANPEWTDLLNLPFRFLIMHDGEMISASLPALPQHILLAAAAFASGKELREQVLHEIAHNWLYLTNDLTPLVTNDTLFYQLPSGTEYSEPLFLLGAAHVSHVLKTFYGKRDDPKSAERCHELTAYLEGCLDLLACNPDILTTEGRKLTRSIGERL